MRSPQRRPEAARRRGRPATSSCARPTSGKREKIAYGILDPAAFAVVSGPSIAETLIRGGVSFRRADNTRISRDKRMGGFDQLRARLKGNEDGDAMLFILRPAAT